MTQTLDTLPRPDTGHHEDLLSETSRPEADTGGPRAVQDTPAPRLPAYVMHS